MSERDLLVQAHNCLLGLSLSARTQVLPGAAEAARLAEQLRAILRAEDGPSQ